MKVKILSLVVAACSAFFTNAQVTALVPQPQEVTTAKGSFTLKKGQTISCNDAALRPAAEYLSAELGLPVGEADGAIKLVLDSAAVKNKAGYTLKVDKGGAVITAADYQGVVNGIATLRQLLPVQPKKASKLSLPYVNISDAPAYDWRGLHLDVSRHFYTADEVKHVLDLMAMYKLNKFHWHLTDDQGWRIEIKKYPKLTENGAWRKFNWQDRECQMYAATQHNTDFDIPTDKMRFVDGDTLYGGYYTQEQIRDVVKYAGQRGIDVIPEVDMPGHILCALQNYDGISCFSTIGWGEVFSSPLCPGKDSALEFCRNVFDEVIDLFPYGYVHLGADEVEKKNWKKCPDCQARIKALGLNSEEELQSWFVHYMEMIFNSHNKRLLGWDEIVEGGLSKSATIMWWRNWAPQSVDIAAKQGNDIILCPSSHCYFDGFETNESMQKLYESPLYYGELTAEQQKCIRGIQGNVWTERIPTMDRVEYMAFPRALAVAEKSWTAKDKQSWNDFEKRLNAQESRLYSLGVNYRHRELDNYLPLHVFTDKMTVKFDCTDPYTEIRYTTDGTLPTAKSKLYKKPFVIKESQNMKVRLFTTNGKPGKIYDIVYEKQPFNAAVEAAGTQDGIQADWYEFKGDRCGKIPEAPFNKKFVCSSIEIPEGAKGNIGLDIHGYIEVPADDVYTFSLLSDDGSTLHIDGALVIDNDKPHGPAEVKGQRALAKGLHPIAVRFFDQNGGCLKMTMWNSKGEEVPVVLKH